MPIRPDHFFYLLGASELALLLFKRSGPRRSGADRGSLAAIWGVIGLSLFMAIWIAVQHRYGRMAPGYRTYVPGVVLFILGIALRWWSIIHLGRWFTVDVTVSADQRIVDDGPYRFIRHPSYTGALVYFLGAGLLLDNWISLLVLMVPITGIFLRRIRIEEAALVDALGQAYVTYMARTKRLVPFVY
ncbi:MAG: isoprenylcysteine carboxylmethyltransferase family protein [Flavobacteriales bacterium]|nr:isoprenylcysteine carboxylmethyltransferase family protein [Flavobacteriales bacterium]MCB9194205.1 isoprenylcysteine carboxylmethyltransferase family protein [Flavobacteriales bacterium]